jgi:hypothetical protein
MAKTRRPGFAPALLGPLPLAEIRARRENARPFENIGQLEQRVGKAVPFGPREAALYEGNIDGKHVFVRGGRSDVSLVKVAIDQIDLEAQGYLTITPQESTVVVYSKADPDLEPHRADSYMHGLLTERLMAAGIYNE